MNSPSNQSTFLKSVEFSSQLTTSKLFEIEDEVTSIIRKMGTPAHLKGYRLLRCAIIKTTENPELIYAVTKELYPLVAKEFSTTPTRVERAIRHAIELTWEQGNTEVLDEYFGYRLKRNFDRPTNSEVIANISDSVRRKFRM